MKVAFYCRAPYSGTQTIFEQETMLLHCMKAMNASLYAIYVDHQSKENLEKRPAFSLLTSDARKNCFQELLCVNPEIFGSPSEESFPVPIHYAQPERKENPEP